MLIEPCPWRSFTPPCRHNGGVRSRPGRAGRAGPYTQAPPSRARASRGGIIQWIPGATACLLRGPGWGAPPFGHAAAGQRDRDSSTFEGPALNLVGAPPPGSPAGSTALPTLNGRYAIAIAW